MSLKIKKIAQPMNETWKQNDLAQRFIAANKKTTLVSGFDDYFVRVVEEKNEILDMDPIILTMVAKEVLKKMKIVLTPEEEKNFIQVFTAVFKSVRQSTLQAIICGNDWDIDKKIKKLHGDMLKVDSKDLKSEDPNKRIIAQFKYYEKKMEKRTMIQNYYWNFKNLNEDVKTFIRHNERAKLNLTDFANTKWKGEKCSKCGNPCCREKKSFCSYCSFADRIKIFGDICNFFHMLGDLYTFYFYLPLKTLEFYNENENFRKIFESEISFSPIKLYATFWHVIKENKKEIDENVRKIKIMKPLLMLQKKRLEPNEEIEKLSGVKTEEKKDEEDIDAIDGKVLA